MPSNDNADGEPVERRRAALEAQRAAARATQATALPATTGTPRGARAATSDGMRVATAVIVLGVAFLIGDLIQSVVPIHVSTSFSTASNSTQNCGNLWTSHGEGTVPLECRSAYSERQANTLTLLAMGGVLVVAGAVGSWRTSSRQQRAAGE
jgi:hypothetical protein